MFRKTIHNNEVSESQRSNNNNGSSCNSFVDGNVDVSHTDADDDNDGAINNGTSKPPPRSRSLYGNRFSQSHAVAVLLAVCVFLPLYSTAIASDVNETSIVLTDPPKALGLVSNHDESNEIATNVELKSESKNDNNFLESPLNESLEDIIRNAVKNEIIKESNMGSPALINALNVMPETENIVLVEYPKATTVATEPIVTSTAQTVPPENTEQCDANTFVCKRVTKKVLTSTTTPVPIEIVPTTITTVETAVEVEEHTDPAVIPVEKEVDTVEDNAREARKVLVENVVSQEDKTVEENVDEDVEVTKTEHKIQLSNTLVTTVENTPQSVENPVEEHQETPNAEYNPTPTVADLESHASTLNDQNNEVVGNTIKNDEVQTPDNNINVTNSLLTHSDIAPLAVLKHISPSGSTPIKYKAYEVEFSPRNDIEDLNNAETKEDQDLHSSTEHNVVDIKDADVEEPVPDNVPTETLQIVNEVKREETIDVKETEHNLTPNIEFEVIEPNVTEQVHQPVPTNDVILPVVADHTDIFTQQTEVITPTTLKSELKSEDDIVTNTENETLSIVFEEPLSATEPSILLENESAEKLLEIENINIPVELTTLLPETATHNVIKKQGVVLVEPEPITEQYIEPTTIVPIVPHPVDIQPDSQENYDYQIDATAAPTDDTNNEETTTAKILIQNENIESNVTTIRPSQTTAHEITEVSMVFPGKNDADVSTVKGSRSINSLHSSTNEEQKVSSNYDVYPAGQTFNGNLAEEIPDGIGKALPTHSLHNDSSNRSTLIIAFSSCTALLFIIVSVGIFLVSFQRQHGTLDIEMQEQRCGKDNLDDEAETCIKLLDVELPSTSLALQTDAEAEIEECL